MRPSVFDVHALNLVIAVRCIRSSCPKSLVHRYLHNCFATILLRSLRQLVQSCSDIKHEPSSNQRATGTGPHAIVMSREGESSCRLRDVSAITPVLLGHVVHTSSTHPCYALRRYHNLSVRRVSISCLYITYHLSNEMPDYVNVYNPSIEDRP